MRVAIVHDWLTGMRGGERVLEAILGLYPEAELYTILHRKGRVSAAIERRPITTSFVQRLPGGERRHQFLLPLLPLAVEQFDLCGYDLVISSSHAVALGALTTAETPHLAYLHTPMRYVWRFYEEYFGRKKAGLLVNTLMRPVTHYLRLWDFQAAQRPDALAANSENVRRRIRKHYRRESTVIHPPIDVDRYRPAAAGAARPAEPSYYLMVTALVPYKRVDVAVEAFRRTGTELRVVGTGPERARLAQSAPANVRFLGRVPEEELIRLYAGCAAFVQTSEEDFGMAPLEAQASGRPVIAYGAGGAAETVVDGETGVLFGEQSADGLEEALRSFEPERFDGALAVANAERFDLGRFRARFLRWVEREAGSSPPEHDPRTRVLSAGVPLG